MRTLGFVGSSRLEGARELLPRLVQDWYAQWCLTNAQASCEVRCGEEVDFTELAELPMPGWLKAQNQAGALWLAGSQASAWHNAVFGSFAHEAPTDETSEHLLAQARLALVNSVMGELRQGAISTLTNQSPCKPGGYLGSRVVLQIKLSDTLLYVLLDVALLECFLPPAEVSEPLTKRESAIGGAKVKLQVRLPLMNLCVGDIKDLSPGDILRTSALLARPLQLATETAEVVAQGYLARQQQQLALQLATPN